MNHCHICPICQKDPTAHSFQQIPAKNNFVNLFYTCSAKATQYFDHTGVLNHIDLLLIENGDKPWVWVFDCTDFTLAHAMEINLGLAISKMITQKYGESLLKIWIIHPTWTIQIMMNAIWPFLSKDLKRKVEITHYSLVEIQNFEVCI